MLMSTILNYLHHDNWFQIGYNVLMKNIKYCPKCKQKINSNLFYRNVRQPDGLSPYCKVHWAEHNKEQHAKRRGDLPDKRRLQMMQVQHDYFHCVERPIQAYILGLLASDGNVPSDRPRIAFSVHQKDRELVEIVRNELAPGSSILTPPCQDYKLAKVCFTSSIMRADLAMLGIIPRKSLILTWPEALPMHLANSYLLGVFDGDGWITFDRRKKNLYFSIGFTSASKPFLERIREVIREAIGVPSINIVANNSAYKILYGGASASAVHEWLHRDLPGLARKRV